ncbi:uncharacterized protein LOC132954540 [Labrus mixtus]|uniref:uncharacterized protein LOC132954540 n=1 Tax=Labrus mixtus TaxID=508554 RepID=UPI0029BFC21F|nr:uncharacterized protein LOC132954540 [Labrus mixtus]
MPQPAQHPLTKVLLLWLTLLSIVQIVFITVFFTVGPHDRSQNCSAVASESAKLMKSNNAHLSPSEHEHQLGKGKMLTFRSIGGGNRRMKWQSKNPSKGLISVQEDVLTIDRDGHYFLSLQVTLKDCNKIQLPEGKYVNISMILTNGSQNPKTLLEGRISTDTCTGFLARATELTADYHKVTIDVEAPSTFMVDEQESLTHLDIIYMSSS